MPKQDSTKIISAKDLGQLSLKDFCPRCFWLERHLGKSPSKFPGIFNTLDSITKKSTKRSFLERGRHPEWLPINNIKKHIKVSRLSIPVIEHGNWILTGDPDDVFELNDGSYHVVDYKTARFTGTQDSLLPMYEAQLNAYAYALLSQGIKPISRLSLIYCEPNENLDTDQEFRLGFTTNPLDIKLNSEMIPDLLRKARKILDNEIPPESRLGCEDICYWVEKANTKINKKLGD